MMMGWINSFYSKLVLGLLASFLLIGLLLMFLVQQLTIRYQNEVEQKLHLELAAHVVGDDSLLKDGEIDQKALKHAFHSMMILGPSFEFYVLTPEGTVTTYSAEDDKIKRMTVDLEPIKQFLSGNEALPILGDDPRSVFRQKIFSVAEIKQQDQLKGYLYIIIGGEIYDSTVDLLKNSHIINLSFWGLSAALLFSLIVVLLLFAMLTRPLRQLTTDMKKFRSEGFDKGVLPASHWDENSSDEIQRLGSTFNAMASTLKQQYEKVRTTDELRRELISYVSHDLRTPLAALQGYLETWQLKQSTLSSAESSEMIQVAANNAQQVSRLVEQLFELAHLDAENTQLTMEPVSIAELAQDVLQKLQLDAERRGIRLDVNPKDPSLMAMADIEKLERVFTNLVDNAIRHCHQGDSVSINISRLEQQLQVTVSDTGAGIAPEDLPHIFDAHYRGRNTLAQQEVSAGNSKSERTNSGLGLAITRRIVELHGSKISVESKAGQGTSFSFLLNGVA
ncbi:HAMP domain-containing sensor histidine kinase [Alkalimarinus sediminis]|uniref:histidine kinase n=1 Tax=Alkalimarinus sediminis TaxID=1632866 RepID=A0A9E8KPX8_9ALTE|nr:HAMP domain-containing sensor histidine kinase [Alkalimarinus sediminis]UZW75184.1 HAMP domain-containing histidine kinase [Alkalimarinus sediminis]